MIRSFEQLGPFLYLLSEPSEERLLRASRQEQCKVSNQCKQGRKDAGKKIFLYFIRNPDPQDNEGEGDSILTWERRRTGARNFK